MNDDLKKTKRDYVKRAKTLEKRMNFAYKMLKDQEKLISEKFGRALVSDEERLENGISPIGEMKDWYNVCYKLRLTIVSFKRNNVDETEKELKHVIELSQELLEKIVLRIKEKNSGK